MGQGIQEWTKKNLWKRAFKKIEEIWSAKADQFFKGCPPQILFDPFLNTLTQISIQTNVPFLCNFKTENCKFSDVLRGKNRSKMS